jgi:hypothetical protein
VMANHEPFTNHMLHDGSTPALTAASARTRGSKPPWAAVPRTSTSARSSDAQTAEDSRG